MLDPNDFYHKVSENGDSLPSFSYTLAEEGDKKLVADVFIKEKDIGAIVLYCIYIGGKGEFASNTLEDAIDEFNK